jgi:small subunit ribosomal protein S21
LQVFVRDNNADQALRVLKKKMQREGVFREMKRRRSYEKSSENSNREKAEAIRRAPQARSQEGRTRGTHWRTARQEGVVGQSNRPWPILGRARSSASTVMDQRRWARGYFGSCVSGLHLLSRSRQMKAFCVDCFLDRIARQVVRRSFVRCYCPGSSPGTVLVRSLLTSGSPAKARSRSVVSDLKT